jgi:thioredoxin reductase (NADPH)
MLFGAESCFTRGDRPARRGGLLTLTLTSGEVTSDVVVVAVGVHYARLAAPGVDELLGTGVFYGAAVSEAAAMRGRPCVRRRSRQLRRAGRGIPRQIRQPGHASGPGRSLTKSMSEYLIKEIEAAPSDHRAPQHSRSPRPAAAAGWNTSRCATRPPRIPRRFRRTRCSS